MRAILPAAMLLLAGCAGGPRPVDMQIVERVVEVQRPCPMTAPTRPAKIGPLPVNAIDALKLVGAKLLEYAGPGAYADRADAAIAICASPPPSPVRP